MKGTVISTVNIRNIIAIAACKTLIKIGKLMGKKGSSAPGSVAMKISPNILSDLAKQVKGDIIMVCGTNGKTTTNNLLCSLIESKGKNVVCNNVGANMIQGVACSFIAKAKLSGKLCADYASIECDEASLRRVVKHITPTKIVVTNLFRDQLDRYGEIEMTLGLLNEAIQKVPDTLLILNADDPLSMQLGDGRNCLYYGIDENCNESVNEMKEGRYCMKCGSELHYNYYHYSQLGDYKCTNCGFTRPTPDYSAKNINLKDAMAFDVLYKGKRENLNLNYRGFYNIYNVLASFAAFESTGLGVENINDVFNNYKPQIGRMEPFVIGGKTIILNLAKNTAGFNQAIATVASDERKKDVLIAINDNPSDGKDISWIWDVDFERLCKANVSSIYTGGMRRHDTALRLKYAGFENVGIKVITKEAIDEIVRQSGDICYLLVNYTALFSIQTILKDMSEEETK